MEAGMYIALVTEDILLQTMFQCKLSVPPPRGNFDFKFACLVYLFFLALGTQPHGPIKVLSAGFNFLPACFIKRSCATLIKHICAFVFTNISEKRLQLS